MPKTTVQGTEESGYLPTGPIDPTLLAVVSGDPGDFLRPSDLASFEAMAQNPTLTPQHVPMSVGARAQVLLELAAIKAAVRTWYEKQPDEVIREASAYSARLTELWTELRLVEPYNREYTQLRTMQVQPVIDEIDRQYKFAQSRIAMARQDIDLIRGGA